MKFSELGEYFERIEATTKRLEKTEILAELLKKIEKEEVRVVVNLALGQLAAPYERIEFNLAEKMLIRAIAQSVGKTGDEVQTEFKRVGDIGGVMAELKGEVSGGEELSITEVYTKLVAIAKEQGTGSQERKVRGLVALLGQSGKTSGKYVVRVVNESLRLGFSESTMLDVFSYYIAGNKEYSLRLEKIYQMRPDLAMLGEEVVGLGWEETVRNAGVKLGIPVIPALAQRLETIEAMIEKMGEVYVEPKLDGTRVQIHYSVRGGRGETGAETTQQLMFEEEKPSVWVKTFTRNLDENTAQFPELLKIKDEIKAEEVILDAEAVGYEVKTGKLLPFQMTITRKRKHGVAEAQKSVPLRFYVFDVLYVDGETLIDRPLSERRARLAQIIKSGEVLVINEAIEASEASEIREYHARQLAAGYEGVLVKKREGVYEPGRAGYNWVKLKEVETAEGKLSDTIDGVVIGYYHGKGKRSGFGIGAFLVGIRDGERLVTIAKIGTGLSDAQFKELYLRAEKAKIAQPRPQYVVDKAHYPDVWVKPEIVVEVAADEITVSPSHTAGYALRFPRLVRFREDKSVAQITLLTELKQIGRLA